jgi:hypothetical protein
MAKIRWWLVRGVGGLDGGVSTVKQTSIFAAKEGG